MKRIAIFDLDGTLYRGNSTFDFLSCVCAENAAYRRYMARYRYLKVLNRLLLRWFRYDWHRRNVVRFLAGLDVGAVEESAVAFYRERMAPRRIEEMHELLAFYRAQGYELCLLTATLDVIADCLKVVHGFDHVFSTRLDVRDGVLLGTFSEDLLHGKKAVFDQHFGGCYSKVVFYSDNREDLALLRSVDCGCLVHAG